MSRGGSWGQEESGREEESGGEGRRIADIPENTLGVDNEESPEGVAVLLEVDAVVLADGVGEVGEQGDVELAEPALGPGAGHPGQVGEVAVH